MLWHVYFGLLVVALWSGWRPSQRITGALLAPPLVRVSALAWLERNPFNGTVFALLTLALLTLLRNFKAAPISRKLSVWIVPGMLLLAFGWTHPHFAMDRSVRCISGLPSTGCWQEGESPCSSFPFGG